MDEDEVDDVFVLDRHLDEADSVGHVGDQSTLQEMPPELENQVKGFLKIARRFKPDALPDKRARDRVYLDAVYNALASRLGQYETSPEADRLLLNDCLGRKKMAVEVRLGEKMLLVEALRLVESRSQEVEVAEPSAKRQKT